MLTKAKRPDEVRPWAINIINTPCHAQKESLSMAGIVNVMWETDA